MTHQIYIITFDTNVQEGISPEIKNIADRKTKRNLDDVNQPFTGRLELKKQIYRFTLYAKEEEKTEKGKINTPQVKNPGIESISSNKDVKEWGNEFTIAPGQRFRLISNDKTNPTVIFERFIDKKAKRLSFQISNG